MFYLQTQITNFLDVLICTNSQNNNAHDLMNIIQLLEHLNYQINNARLFPHRTECIGYIHYED